MRKSLKKVPSLNLRERLKPTGKAPLVRLFLKGKGNDYFSFKFVAQCIDDLEKKSLAWEAGLDEPSAMERLAMHVLIDSAKG